MATEIWKYQSHQLLMIKVYMQGREWVQRNCKICLKGSCISYSIHNTHLHYRTPLTLPEIENRRPDKGEIISNAIIMN